jgi:hypothetical protein
MFNHAVTRRQLLASGVSATTVLVLARFATAAGTLSDHPEVSTFFEPRFPTSRTLAVTLPGASQLLVATGDPSHLLAKILGSGTLDRPKRIQGVTTETLPFCLEQLARRQHEVHFESQRLDRDLFAWSLQIRPRTAAV